MGRHRRLDAGSAADERADGTATSRGAGTHRRKKRAPVPVRTGLLGASAAVAMGAVAVASGLIPGAGDGFGLADGGKEPGTVRAADTPSDLETQGSSSPEREEPAASRGSERPKPSASSPAPSPTKPSASPTPSAKPTKEPPKADSGAGDAAQAPQDKPKAPAKTPSAAPEKPADRAIPATNTEQTAEADVLALVNKERAQAGCSPVRADVGLAKLAGDFSQAMAEGGFFDHVDPSGRTPWDRAEAAGITDLGGENIARGQANAQSVMDSWMNSPGHRANILNCEYKSLGVGAHFAPGGPWWTQDFGF